MATVALYVRKHIADVETKATEGVPLIEQMCRIAGAHLADDPTPVDTEAVYTYIVGAETTTISVVTRRQP